MINYSLKEISDASSRIEAEDRISIMWARWREFSKLIVEDNFSKFIIEGV